MLHTPKKVQEKLLFHLIRQTFKKRKKTCIMHSKNNYNYASKGSSTKVMYSSVVSCLVLYLIWSCWNFFSHKQIYLMDGIYYVVMPSLYMIFHRASTCITPFFESIRWYLWLIRPLCTTSPRSMSTCPKDSCIM